MTRSYLYVPADRPDRLTGALDRGADAIIADLEDGVARSAKDQARANVVAWLGDSEAVAGDPTDEAADHRGRPDRWVRINSDDRTIGDLDAIVRPNIAGVVLPKATSQRLADIEDTLTYLESDRGIEPLAIRVNALIESAQGVLDAVALAANARVDRLAIGEADLTAELGIDPLRGEHGLWPLRMQLVVASTAAGIAAPVGPVHTDVADLDRLRATSADLAAAGFGARSTIHPSQIPVVNDVFAPTTQEIEWAEKLITEFSARTDDGLGVYTDAEGSMVDEAVVRRAWRIVATARQYA